MTLERSVDPSSLKLFDPLYRLRKGWIYLAALMAAPTAVLLVLFLLLAWYSVSADSVAAHDPRFWNSLRTFAQSTAIIAVLSLITAFVITRPLPAREVNAIYLRSFRNDRRSFAMRLAVYRALGKNYFREFRLSGIRDPARREVALSRTLSISAFAARYSTPKYMNLEAGDDWHRRLTATLLDARCAIVDAVAPSAAVEHESVLAYRCLGFERVLFLVDDLQTEAQWGAEIRKIVERFETSPVKGEPRLAVWRGTAQPQQEAFLRRVHAFAESLPQTEADRSKTDRADYLENIPAAPPGRDSYNARAMWSSFGIWFFIFQGLVCFTDWFVPIIVATILLYGVYATLLYALSGGATTPFQPRAMELRERRGRLVLLVGLTASAIGCLVLLAAGTRAASPSPPWANYAVFAASAAAAAVVVVAHGAIYVYGSQAAKLLVPASLLPWFAAFAPPLSRELLSACFGMIFVGTFMIPFLPGPGAFLKYQRCET